MKKIYPLIFLSALFIGSVNGQNNNFSGVSEKNMKHTGANINEVSNLSIDYTSADRQNPFDTIWYEDFGAGISSWTVSGTDAIWRKTGKCSSGPFEGNATATINSTTKANGCIIFDADSMNFANHPSTPPSGAGYVDLNGSITSPTIDCSGKPSVILKFQQYFRLCCSQATTALTLSVSNNGGTTWTDFDCKGTTDINSYNQSSAVPNVPNSINISAVAANQANVKVRFTFFGQTYFWQVDDVVLIEGPNNDIINSRVFADFSYVDGGYYTMTPRKQVVPITFRGAIFNNGGLAQTNVVMNVDITSGSSVYNQNSNTIASFPTISVDTLQVTTPFTPSDSMAASYTAVFTVSQTQTDEAPVDNIATKTFAVSDTVFARDNGVTTTADIGPGNYVDGDVDGAAMANLFEFPVEEVAVSVSVFIDANTTNGTSISAGIWDASGTTIAEAPDAESDIFDISSNADKNKWVTLPLITPFTLNANGSYLAGIRTYGVTSTIEVLFREDAVTEQPDFTTFVLAGSPLDWGWVTTLPAIRLNVQAPDISKKEISAGGVKLYQNMPNPFNNSTFINYEISKNENVTLTIFDVTGKQVASINEGNKSAGNHTIEVTTALKPGVYFYTLKAGDYSLTKKMTVLK